MGVVFKEVYRYNYIPIIIITFPIIILRDHANISRLRVRESRDFHVRGTDDVSRKLQLTACLMVKLRFRLGLVTTKQLAHSTAR